MKKRFVCAQISVSSAAVRFLYLQQLSSSSSPLQGRISWNTSSEFINCFFGIADRFFFLLTWQAMLKSLMSL